MPISSKETPISGMMDSEFERRSVRRKFALAFELIKGRETVEATSRRFDLTPAEVQSCVKDGKRDTGDAWGPDCRPSASSMSGGSMTFRELTPSGYWRFALGKSWRPCWIATRADVLSPAGLPTSP